MSNILHRDVTLCENARWTWETRFGVYRAETYKPALVNLSTSVLTPTQIHVVYSTQLERIVFVLQPETEEDEFRYVPDLTLLELKAQAAELEKAKEDRKKKQKKLPYVERYNEIF